MSEQNKIEKTRKLRSAEIEEKLKNQKDKMRD